MNPRDIDNINNDIEVNTLVADAAGNIWGGTNLKGLFILDTVRAEVVALDKENQVPATAHFKKILKDKANRMWVGTQYNQLGMRFEII